MILSDEKLKTLLIQNKVGDSATINKYEQAAHSSNVSLYSYLITNGIFQREEIAPYIASKIGVPYIDLKKVDIPKQTLEIVPEIVAEQQYFIAFKKDDKGIHVAMNDPSEKELEANFKKRVETEVVVYFADEESFNHAFSFYEKHDIAATQPFEQIVEEFLQSAKQSTNAEDLPTIRLVDELFIYAHKNKTSDIHIEPHEHEAIIRFRIDGILHDIAKLPSKYHDLVVARTKILSRLRTDEHQAPQDGKLRFNSGETRVDVRVSIVPLVYGEKIVMRLLSEKARQFDLENLGFDESSLKKILKSIRTPWGMILVTGPTGSGKTTTLYGVLKRLNTREVNISTIEDPVEYDMEGINQIQVNNKTNLTFAAGLRSILRQDPDVIMVGEIRDEETAKIAVNSAMTGHLVLSTLHTNDAPTALPRLLDMSIEGFLVASTVNIIIAQRLVRKLCETCKEKREVTEEMKLLIKQQFTQELIERYKLLEPETVLFYAKGCEKCDSTGYKGRLGIFEVIEMTQPIKQLIMEKANANLIKELAIKEGMKTMIEDGIEKALAGTTSIVEILRVAKE